MKAIAMVISNWHNVLRAINMASGRFKLQATHMTGTDTEFVAQLAKPPPQEETLESEEPSMSLPQTLVRIPTEHAPTLQAQAENAAENAESSIATP